MVYLKVINIANGNHAYVQTNDDKMIDFLFSCATKPIKILLDDINEGDFVNICLRDEPMKKGNKINDVIVPQN